MVQLSVADSHSTFHWILTRIWREYAVHNISPGRHGPVPELMEGSGGRRGAEEGRSRGGRDRILPAASSLILTAGRPRSQGTALLGPHSLTLYN